MNTKIIAISNQKGGEGKTTSAVNISAELSRIGEKVMLIDFDPQASLTEALGYDSSSLEYSIANILEDRIMNRHINVDKLLEHAALKIDENLTLIPSSTTLTAKEILLATVTSREFVLKKILKSISDVDYDYVFIDCPSSFNLLTINALAASDSVLIPIKAQFLDFKGFNQLYETIASIKEDINPNLKILGAYLTMYDERINIANQIKEALSYLDESMGIKVFDTKITTCTKAAEAAMAGKNIFDYAPKSKTAKEYKRLVQELIE